MSYRENMAAKLHFATNRDGGATFWKSNPLSDHVGHGYVIGGRVGLSVVPPVSATVQQYAKAIKAIEAVTEDEVGLFIGTWIEDQHVYVDAVSYTVSRDEAIRIGRERGEISIYEVTTDSVIYL